MNGQSIEAVAKHANTFDFYGHTYTITVPTTVKNNVAISPVRNLANTVYTPEGGTSITLTSDPVETAIYHTVVTRYIDDDTEELIANPVSRDYAHGDHYTTTESDDIPEKYTLVETPDNAEGTADKDYEVIYRYRKVKNPNTADGSVVDIAGAVAASVLGGGIVLINKRRR